MAAAESYQLYYFDLRGLAEPIRLLFAYTGQPFQDTRFCKDDWAKLKPTFFYGKVPVLEVTGGGGKEKKLLAQSGSILRYLADKFGLAGKDDWERAKVGEAYDFIRDVGNEMRPYFTVKMGFQPGNLAELKASVFEPALKTNMPLLVKLLGQSKSGFIAASGLTFVDLALADVIFGLDKLDPGCLGAYPELLAYQERVFSANDALKKYVQGRKV